MGFGSLKFLQSSETKTLKSLQINDVWMLFLRILLIALLCTILSSILIRNTTENDSESITFIDPYYKNNSRLASLADSTENLKWLSKGFPDFSDSLDLAEFTDWDLLNKIPEADSITILSPFRITKLGFPNVNTHVKSWISLPEELTVYQQDTLTKGDSTFYLEVNTEAYFTQSDWISTEAEGSSKILLIYIESDSKYQDLEKIVRASLASIQLNSPISIDIVSDSTKADWIFWLSDRKFKKVDNIFFIDNDIQNDLEIIYKNIVGLNSNLTAKQAVLRDFPLRLEKVLMEREFSYKKDNRIILRDQLPKYIPAGANKSDERRSVDDILWVTWIFLFLLERTLSHRSKA